MNKPLLLAAASLAVASPSSALEFRTTTRPAILYAAPSQFAARLAVAGPGVPFEIFVETGSWTKARDVTGRLVWLERSALGNTHSVMVNVDQAQVLQQPTPGAEVRFRAARGVLLQARGAPRDGWFEVQHVDGLRGWVRRHEVWGE